MFQVPKVAKLSKGDRLYVCDHLNRTVFTISAVYRDGEHLIGLCGECDQKQKTGLPISLNRKIQIMDSGRARGRN